MQATPQNGHTCEKIEIWETQKLNLSPNVDVKYFSKSSWKGTTNYSDFL